ncbi:MAG: N-acetyltransferase [Deltaproteobacteria bacterium]|nr:N-acetyltransferase [Deltaproteobacteria bacterium]
MVTIREESEADVEAIRRVNVAAFAGEVEARLVEALRANGALVLSLVAEVDGRIAGHVAFSPVTVGAATGVGLAPMAVVPELQRTGLGGRMIDEALRRLAHTHRFCVVLGHPAYYPRFGFVPASTAGLHWEHGHDEAFFVKPLVAGGLDGVRGIVRYRPELDAV